MLERLVLKNAVECTSQRLKRTSGARVLTVFGSQKIAASLFVDVALRAASILKNRVFLVFT